MSVSKKICLIYTGGTIGMHRDSNGTLSPPDNPNDFLMLAPELKNSYCYDYDFVPVVDETVPPVFVFASSHKTSLFERELVWNVDAQSYFFDGEGKYLGHPEMVIAAGARWKFSEELALRAGIGELDISGGIHRSAREYWETFSPRIALGFSYNLKKFKQGAFFNYALTTDRVWAGVDQQFDITVSF